MCIRLGRIFKSVLLSVAGDTEPLEHSYAADVSVNWCSNSRKQLSTYDKAENTLKWSCTCKCIPNTGCAYLRKEEECSSQFFVIVIMENYQKPI